MMGKSMFIIYITQCFIEVSVTNQFDNHTCELSPPSPGYLKKYWTNFHVLYVCRRVGHRPRTNTLNFG